MGKKEAALQECAELELTVHTYLEICSTTTSPTYAGASSQPGMRTANLCPMLRVEVLHAEFQKQHVVLPAMRSIVQFVDKMQSARHWVVSHPASGVSKLLSLAMLALGNA